MAYWTPQALGPLAQSESSGNASLIHYPSGYTPSGARSSASGLYGYLDSTWQTYAAQAGVDVTQYPRAYMAPADVQSQVALITPISNWTCPGCNAKASQLALDPSNVTETPIANGPADSSSGLNAGPSAGGTMGDIPATLSGEPSGTSSTAPTAPGSLTATGADPQGIAVKKSFLDDLNTWISGLATDTGKAFSGAAANAFGGVENWFVRAFLVIVGIVVIAVALLKIMNPDMSVRQVATRAGKAIAA